MGFADLYLSKQKGFRPYFTETPSGQLRFIVVIPAYHEPDLILSLESLLNCKKPEGHVEVMAILNMPENDDREKVKHIRHAAEVTAAWIRKHSIPDFRYLLMDNLVMPVKDAGVGLARKTGMDQAAYRFNIHDNADGYILSFDADSRCETNYFTAIEETLKTYPSTKGFNLFFEHPVSGNDYPDAVYRGIIAYELHLRYLNLFMRYTGFPFAFHTVGSCFGVKADTYVRQGGMNKRKAGEDFYFLHKIIPLGEFREINTTCVIPSPRESDRVPFGTGAAISKYLASGESGILTYPPACFHDLKQFFQLTGSMFRMTPGELVSSVDMQSPPLKDYLTDIHFVDAIREIRSNSRSADTFINRFFRWFDAFRIIKYLNFASRTCYGQIPVNQAVRTYLNDTDRSELQIMVSDADLLMVLREIEKGRV